MSSEIRISEIFGPTIQGEGVLIGCPTVFVRTGGCDYRCSWCDTLHAVDSSFRDTWVATTTEDVWQKVKLLSGDTPLMVSLSGGNPAIQPLGDLIALGHREGYTFALETQGSVFKDWFAELDVLVLSPKPPSSGMAVDWQIFSKCVNSEVKNRKTILKIVVFDDLDYAFARDVANRYPSLELCLQPGNDAPEKLNSTTASPEPFNIEKSLAQLRWLVDRVSADRWFSARVLPQLHALLWGNMRGV